MVGASASTHLAVPPNRAAATVDSVESTGAVDTDDRFLVPVNDVYSMGSKQVRLDDDVYAEIADEKRQDETFSEAIDRLVSDWRLSEWGTGRSREEIDAHREALESMDRIEAAETEQLREELGLDDE